MSRSFRFLRTGVVLLGWSLATLSTGDTQESRRNLSKLRATVVVEDPKKPPAWVTSLGKLDRFDVRAIDAESLDADATKSTSALVISALPKNAKKAYEAIDAAGKSRVGLVFVGRTAIDLAARSGSDDPLSRNVPLSRVEHPGPLDSKKAIPLTVEVLDQRVGEVQCFTNFHQAGWLSSHALTFRAKVLARAFATQAKLDKTEKPGVKTPPETVPVVWIAGSSFGRFVRGPRTVVTTLDPASGPSSTLVETLIGRAIETTSGRRATVKIRGDFSLVAETLGPNDHGIAAGVLPRKGFFRGRQISQVMSYHGANWLIRSSRQHEEKPDAVIRELGIGPGQMIADVGCGNGYFSLRMAKKVGPKGKVYGVDIQKEMLTLLEQRAAKAKITNVVPVLCTATDPKLPADTIDLALMVDVYHELSDPAPVIAGVRKSLKKDGRLVLVEYRGEDPTVQIKPLHRTTVQQMRAELAALGFRFIKNKTFLPSQHILIFGKSSTPNAPNAPK